MLINASGMVPYVFNWLIKIQKAFALISEIPKIILSKSVLNWRDDKILLKMKI
jgi:hypothetical protein